MPKNLFQTVIFTIMMVIVMVYAMICYNIALGMGAMNTSVFLLAFKEMLIMAPIAFLIDFVFVGRFAMKKASEMVDMEKTHPFQMVLAISAVSVICMCPTMSLAATLLFQREVAISNGVIATWFQTTVLNFPMAFFWQFCYAGPFVRFLFRTIFKESNNEPEAAEA
jgi:hypothetical protein